jgi:hypothetical protein
MGYSSGRNNSSLYTPPAHACMSQQNRSMVDSSEQTACDAILTQALLTEFGADMLQLRKSAYKLKLALPWLQHL